MSTHDVRPSAAPVARLRRTLLVVVLLLTFTTVTSVGVGIAGSGNNLLRTLGDATLVPNVLLQTNLKFAPGTLQITSGDTLAVEHADKSEAPHTLTIVEPGELPQTIEDVFDPTACPTCEAAKFEHFGNGTLVVDGDNGFNEVGDSVLFFHGDRVEIDVTAPPGESLSFLCVIHPWMQGTINVK